MKALIDAVLQYGDFFIAVIAIVPLVILMKYWFKKTRTFIIVSAVLVAGIVFIVIQAKYPTFQDVVAPQLNEDSTIQAITITVNDLSSDRPEREGQVTIRDKDIIEKILADLSNLKLKEDRSAVALGRKYHLNIRTTNEVDDNFFKTSTLMMNVDQHYLNKYKITNEPDHLETIESLVENDEIDWKDLSEFE